MIKFSVHRGVKVSVDPKGNNFCVLQTQPNSELNDLPWIQHRSLSKDLLDLYPESNLKDLTIKIQSQLFPVHKYILAASNPKFASIIDEHSEESIIDLSELTDVPELFEQVLKYAYYQDCDMMKEGVLPFKIHRKTATRNYAEFSNQEMHESAHQVYAKNKKKMKNNESSNSNILIQLQDLARRLGFHDMVKNLDHFVYNVITNSIKKKVKGSILCPTVKTWSRTSDLVLKICDVIILTEDQIEFRAHKCILSARLEYFRSMFSMGWIESAQKITEVKLPITGPLCQTLLEYLYTDLESIPNCSDPEFLCNVLVMADQLLIPRLIQVCEKQLTSLLTLKNVGEILQFAHDFNAEQLIYHSMQFVCYNIGALIESKGLDTVDTHVLKEVSKHYQAINRALSSRKITPYTNGPTTEEIEAYAVSLNITVEELFEIETEQQQLESSNTVSRKKRSRKLSTESTNSSSGTDSETDVLNVSKTSDNIEVEEDILNDLEQLSLSNNDNFTLIESKGGPRVENVIESFFNDPKKFTNKLPAAALNSSTTESSKKFNKLSQKERKRLQSEDQKLLTKQSFALDHEDHKPKWTGWGITSKSPAAAVVVSSTSNSSPESPSLASIMQNERESKAHNISSVKSKNSNANSPNGIGTTNKRTRKSSWRSLNFSDNEPSGCAALGGSAAMATSPPNPWKPLPPPRVEKQQSLQEILHEESMQSQNLSRTKSKAFHVTQLEESAIQELRTFYNVDNVFDEFITVDRVEQGVLATPIWRKRKTTG